jgi:hypothetical protein
MATTGWQELRRVGERLLSDEKVNPESLEALSPSITAQVSAETLSHPTRIPKCAEVQIERVKKDNTKIPELHQAHVRSVILIMRRSRLMPPPTAALALSEIQTL